MTIQVLKILHSKNEFHYFKKNSKKELPQNILSFIHTLEYPSQMVFRPSHSINPPGGTGTVSSAVTEAAARPAWVIGPVMPSITLMNTTVQQCINRTYDSTC